MIIKKIKLDQIKSSVQLGRAIYREDSSTLFAKGTIISKKQMLLLRKMGITEIEVMEDEADEKNQLFQQIDLALSDVDLALENALAGLEGFSPEAKIPSGVGEKENARPPLDDELIEKKSMVQGESVSLADIDPGRILASTFYRKGKIILSTGTVLMPQYIDYLKKNGIKEAFVEKMIQEVAKEAIVDEISIEEKIRIMANYNGDPGIMFQIMGWFDDIVNKKQIALIEPLTHLARYGQPPLNVEALACLGKMNQQQAFDSLLNLYISGDETIAPSILEAFRDTRDQKTLINRLVNSMVFLEKNFRDRIIDFMMEFPPDILEQAVQNVLLIAEDELKLIAFSILNKLKTMDKLSQLEGEDARKSVLMANFEAEKKTVATRKFGLKMEFDAIEKMREYSVRIMEFDPTVMEEDEIYDCIRELGRTRDSRAMGALQYALDFLDINFKREALRAIMQVYAPNQLSLLLGALRFDDAEMEAMVKAFFAQKNDAYTISFIIRHLNEGGGVIRKRILKLIAQLPRERVIGVVEKLRERGSDNIKNAAILTEDFLGRN